MVTAVKVQDIAVARERRARWGDRPAALTTDELANELRLRGWFVFPPSLDPIELPGFTLDPSRLQVTYRGTTVSLTRRMLEVLTILARAWPRGIMKAQITTALWGYDPYSNSATQYLHYLRKRVPGMISDNFVPTRHNFRTYWLNLDAEVSS